MRNNQEMRDLAYETIDKFNQLVSRLDSQIYAFQERTCGEDGGDVRYPIAAAAEHLEGLFELLATTAARADKLRSTTHSGPDCCLDYVHDAIGRLHSTDNPECEC